VDPQEHWGINACYKINNFFQTTNLFKYHDWPCFWIKLEQGQSEVAIGRGGGATRHLLRDGGVESPNSQATPQGLDQKSKMEVVPKMTRRRGSDAGNPGEGELDPAEGVRRHCKKNYSVLSCIGKRTREGCDRGSKVWTVHSG